MDIVQITDRILVSIGIGMSAAFHLFRGRVRGCSERRKQRVGHHRIGHVSDV